MEYELWLDESGDFIEEKAKKSNPFLCPSLVGGVLLKKEIAERINLGEIIDDRNHANELDSSEKVSYVLPILERMKNEYGAIEVFFENREYEEKDNRSLYLNIISEGILQLLQYLNSLDETVNLYVIIAQRQDVEYYEYERDKRRIKEKEYIAELKRLYNLKMKDRRVYFNEGCKLNIAIDVADRNRKLQIADFICNTRLIRFSNTFKEEKIQERLKHLYEDALEFSLYEKSSESIIHSALARGSLKDAAFELYSSIDDLDERSILEQMMERVDHMNYRLIKSQLKDIESDVISYVANTYDFEQGELFLKNLLNGFIKKVYKKTNAYPNLQCTVYLNLIDMYLREGAILEARDVFREAESVFEKVEQNFDNWLLFYQLKEKKALYYIDSFQYEQAVEEVKKANRFFETIFSVMRKENAKSEYYGDSLCMMIYAYMFIQRRRPELYDQLIRYSDIAMKQYPNYEGELERHRQYRSHIELEKGNYEKALWWLIKAKNYYIGKVDRETIDEFLKMINESEGVMSCQYYLMYYLLIMSEAARNKCELAQIMSKALNSNEELKLKTGLLTKGQRNIINDLKDDYEIKDEYHPMEVVYWKMASFLSLQKNKEDSAKYYFRKACELCFRRDNYLTMKITGLGIATEYLSNYDDKPIKGKMFRALDEITRLNLDTGTAKFVEEFIEVFKRIREKTDQQGKLALFDLSRRITY